jgi:putative ABC transport system substrate-binding protein
MNEKSWLRVVNSCSDNLKVILSPSVVSTLSRADGLWIDSAEGSKIFTEKCRSIKNLKWVWIVAVGVAIALCGAVAQAQQTQKTWKIGVLVSGTASINASRDEAMRQGLRELGYEEGKNLTIDYKYAEGKTDRLPQLAKELVAEKPDVIVVGGTAVAVAAKNVTSTIPIVVAGAGDLVEAGLIKSFMYPGGNVTGVARLSADFFGDRLKLIKEILPKAKQITSLSNPNNPGHTRSLKDAELGARSSGLSFQSVTARSAKELDGAIGSASKGGASALFILSDALFNNHVGQIAQTSIKNRLPSIYDRSTFVDAGGLMSYGVNLADLSRRAAEYIHQIFKGAKPGDLTLVQPIKFDLSVNLKTAEQIGVTIPPEVLQRAVKVIK